MDRTNRSNKYQHFFTESSCSPEMLAEFADAEGMTAVLSLSKYNDELQDLKEQLKNEFWRLVDTQLTSRQREVIRLYAQGFTQIEIAKQLKVNQSSITKSINGNCDYRSGRKIYGGAKKKLRKLAEKDEKICAIVKRIAEIESGYEV
jgi:DNA-binding CsgD family transcriptional regulator